MAPPSCEVMVPWLLVSHVLGVWCAEPLRLSPAECRASSTLLLAAQTLRRSSQDWLRVLCQEIIFLEKYTEIQVALLTVPYLRLPESVQAEIFHYLAVKPLDMMSYIGEIGCVFTVPRSLATPELGHENFRLHETRKELTRRLKLESQLHNTIRTWNSRLVRLNLQISGKLAVLEGRVPHFAQIARLPLFSSRPCQNSLPLR